MKVCVIGGSNIDLVAESFQALKINDSNPGLLHKSIGGVGRNIAENLGRLNVATSLITVLGDNADGALIKKETEATGVKVYPIYKETQPTYLAILDDTKDMHIAISSMEAMEQLSVEDFLSYEEVVNQSDLIVIDANLPDHILKTIFERFKQRIIADGISTVKVKKLTPYLNKIHTLKLNTYEAHALTHTHDSFEQVKQLLERGIKQVYVTAGQEGVYYNQDLEILHHKVKPVNALNATGAGDSFCAGLIYGIHKNLDPLYYGIKASEITLKSPHAVSKTMHESLMNMKEKNND